MNLRKWIIGGVAGAASVACGLAVATAQGPAQAGKPPAVVNGEVITQVDLDAALRQAGPMPVQLPEERRKQYQVQALYGLIDQALMRQYLARNAKPLPPGEVERKIGEMESLLRKQGKTLQDACREANQTEAQFRAGMAQHLQWQAFAREHVTDAELAAYYKEYKDLFDRVTVRVSDIFVPLPSTATETERAQARARLTELRTQLAAGTIDFAAAAKANSRGPAAETGGDLGYVPRKWVLEEPLARATFALPVNQLSDIVETEFGLHLIKVTDRKAGQPSDFAKIKDDVREVYIEDMFFNVLAQQRKAARVEINLP
jgi:parvulin-like peptidyl-prolyl isomerase